MSTLKKFAASAALAAGLAVTGLAATAPVAQAGVHVGIGVGVGPAYYGHGSRWCYNHPRKCHRGYYGPAVVAGPRIGVFYTGRGWWDGHRYWGHRYRWHGGWRYR
ncbi:MAG TPA: hypothetical protein VG889_04745 [Rhizomicrobium sp.]|nr:hypothetical protein [Rhizomicrobium sp.]